MPGIIRLPAASRNPPFWKATQPEQTSLNEALKRKAVNRRGGPSEGADLISGAWRPQAPYYARRPGWGIRRAEEIVNIQRIRAEVRDATTTFGWVEVHPTTEGGGDSMSVNDASALEETLARIRQRYTLYFNLPEGLQQGQERNIEVDLTATARLRRSDAEVRYRRVFMSSNGGSDAAPVRVTHAPAGRGYSISSARSTDTETPKVHRRRVAVNEDGTVPVPDDAPASPPVQPAPSP
jgi:hypothetical protein